MTSPPALDELRSALCCDASRARAAGVEAALGLPFEERVLLPRARLLSPVHPVDAYLARRGCARTQPDASPGGQFSALSRALSGGSASHAPALRRPAAAHMLRNFADTLRALWRTATAV